ncbi:hypothetical protein F5879DRAFT_72713 [Lentinula edodes]|nr:hypothetical protein F5879DRAFT_72713 [Lentinula edodes]
MFLFYVCYLALLISSAPGQSLPFHQGPMTALDVPQQTCLSGIAPQKNISSIHDSLDCLILHLITTKLETIREYLSGRRSSRQGPSKRACLPIIANKPSFFHSQGHCSSTVLVCNAHQV